MQPKPTNHSVLGRIMEHEERPDWSLGLAIFFVAAYLVLWVCGQFGILTLGLVSSTSDIASAIVYGALIGCIVLIIGLVIWARRRMEAEWVDGLSLRQPRNQSLFLVILIGLAAAWAIDLVAVLLHLKSDQVIPVNLALLALPIGLNWMAAAIFAIIIQPIAEGLVYAGILYPALAREEGSNIGACLIVAAIYAISSAAILAVGDNSWFALVQPFLMTLVVVLVRAYTKSTYSAIVARALFGLFFVLAAVISARF